MKRTTKVLIVFIFIILFIFCIISALKYRNQVKNLNSRNIELIKEINTLKVTNSKKHLIDIELEKCINNDYSTAGMTNCVDTSANEWTKEIEKYYSLLEKVMTKEQFKALQNSQKIWEKYKQAQFNVNKSVFDNVQGTMYINILASEQMNIIKQRARELENLYYFCSKK